MNKRYSKYWNKKDKLMIIIYIVNYRLLIINENTHRYNGNEVHFIYLKSDGTTSIIEKNYHKKINK